MTNIYVVMAAGREGVLCTYVGRLLEVDRVKPLTITNSIVGNWGVQYCLGCLMDVWRALLALWVDKPALGQGTEKAILGLACGESQL